MNRLFPDNTFFPHLFPSGLKLRLDQTDNAAAIPKEGLHRSQNFGQRDEGHINGCEINGFRNLFRRHIADIRLFHADHTAVIPQFPGQLSMAHIYCIYLYRAVLQHAVGETAGGRSHIHTDLAVQQKPEAAHGLF